MLREKYPGRTKRTEGRHVLFKRALKINPENRFPEEVIELKRQGVPLPTWYAGPLYDPSAYSVREALGRIVEARRSADDTAIDDGEQPSF